MDGRDGDSPKGPERRQHRRYPVRFSVTVEPEGSQESLDGALLDVSERGLLLFLTRTLPVGDRVGIQLEAPGAAFTLPGRIVWVAKRKGLSHVHGVELEREQDWRFAQRLYEMAHELW